MRHRIEQKWVAGFTLIELLIVVAIIAILAAIAVPNFLEAQTRSKVSRAKSDMRTIALGVDSFYVDNHRFPANPNATKWGADSLWTEYIAELTTPISYLTGISSLRDPFNPSRYSTGSGTSLDPGGNVYIDAGQGSYMYTDWGIKNKFCWGQSQKTMNDPKYPGINAYGLYSWGPDRAWTRGMNMVEAYYPRPLHLVKWADVDIIYDPTNGTVSRGDIARFGGECPATTTP